MKRQMATRAGAKGKRSTDAPNGSIRLMGHGCDWKPQICRPCGWKPQPPVLISNPSFAAAGFGWHGHLARDFGQNTGEMVERLILKTRRPRRVSKATAVVSTTATRASRPHSYARQRHGKKTPIKQA